MCRIFLSLLYEWVAVRLYLSWDNLEAEQLSYWLLAIDNAY